MIIKMVVGNKKDNNSCKIVRFALLVDRAKLTVVFIIMAPYSNYHAKGQSAPTRILLT